MKTDEAVSFLQENHRTVLATYRADGRVQLSPVVCGAKADGVVLISTRAHAAKTVNITRNPAVFLCVMNDAFFGSWMQIDGTARVVRQPDALEGLVEYYRMIGGEHPNWAEYREAMVREERVLLEITVERVGPTWRR